MKAIKIILKGFLILTMIYFLIRSALLFVDGADGGFYLLITLGFALVYFIVKNV